MDGCRHNSCRPKRIKPSRWDHAVSSRAVNNRAGDGKPVRYSIQEVPFQEQVGVRHVQAWFETDIEKGYVVLRL